MRRALGAVVVAALMAISSVAFAGLEETGSYKDVFPNITYSGSAGSIPWGYSPWQEIGENDGPGSGWVHVYTGGCYDYKCLNIEGHEDVGARGAMRFADLSQFLDAEICFDVMAELEEEEEDLSKGVLSVQVTDDGQNWTTLGSYGLEDLNWSPRHGQFSLDDFLGEGSGIRFVVTGTLFGEVYVDNVEIKGTIGGISTSTSSTSSTTSTTKPKPTTTTEHQSTTTTSDSETTSTRPSITTTTIAETTTTTIAETTTSTVEAIVPVGPVGPPPESGLRDTDGGVQANYSQDLFGAMDVGQTEVLGAEFDAEYSMAVEVFSATWIWLVTLLLIIATAIVSGLDRRRPSVGVATT